MRIIKTTPCLFLTIVVGVLVVRKMIILYANGLSISYSFDAKRRETDYSASHDVFEKESYFQHSTNNKHNTCINIKEDKWDNTLAVAKLKQMILGNAQKQLYVRAQNKL